MRVCQRNPHFFRPFPIQLAPSTLKSHLEAGFLPALLGKAPGAPAWLLPAGRPRSPQCRLCSPSWVKNAAFVSSAQPSRSSYSRSPKRVPPSPAVASCCLVSFIYFCFLALAGEKGDMRLLAPLGKPEVETTTLHQNACLLPQVAATTQNTWWRKRMSYEEG